MKNIIPFILVGLCSSSCQTTTESSVRVINGEVIGLPEFPGVVTLVREDGSRCGGVAIGPNAVATAAHCLSDQSSGGLRAQFYEDEDHLITTKKSVAAFISDELAQDIAASKKSIIEFFAEFEGDVQVGKGKDSYQAIAVDANEFRGPNGHRIGPLDFALVVFDEAPFKKVHPIFTEAPPTDVFFVGRGVYTDKLRKDGKKRKGTTTLPASQEEIYITESDPKKDHDPNAQNSAAAIGDSGVPLLANVDQASDPVTIAVNSSGGYWHKGIYYGRFSALPLGADDFTRENIWIPILSTTSLAVMQHAVTHAEHPAKILFFPNPPKFAGK